MERDKGHLVNIEKVEYNTYNTNHVDTSEILSLLNILKLQNQKIMAKAQEQFDTLMQRLDTVTNDIAQDYQTLLNKIIELNDGSVSQASLDQHAARITQLEGIGASVENPVPPPEEPTPPTE
jgi:hypothetical protein